MNYEPHQRDFGWTSRLGLAALAVVLLPLSPGIPASTAADTPYPQIVKTSPAVGATGIDPATKEITVTFDRDMGTGMSWTGGPPGFPPTDEGRKAAWKDARTCVLPVKLEPGKFYRVGINSKSYQNFKGKDGVAAPPSEVHFTTQGATAEVERQARVPQIARLEPKNGAADVDPKTETLKVTFNMPMGEGMSWTGGGPAFPKLAESKQASWSEDRLTCTLPVALEPDREYQLGLNSLSHNNFQSQSGVPLPPAVYTFRTRSTK